MPRASNGTYSLPAGNPVVTGTTIASSWANNTMSDLATAMTDSLSRSGDGSMLAPLLLDDGVVGAPALSFGSETTSGLYRAGSGDVRISVLSNAVAQFTANGVRAAAGAVATPGLSFIGDTNTGWYSAGADDMRASVGGVDQLTLTTTIAALAQVLRLPNGAVGAPSISFTSDTDLGIYRSGTDILSFTTAGTLAGSINATGRLNWIDGAVGTPAYSFTSDPDSGMYRIGANNLGFAVNGGLVVDFSTTALTTTLSYRAPDGSAGTPAVSFTNDPNTGLYSFGADQIGLTTGGTFRAVWSTSVHTLRLQLQNQDGSVGTPSYSFENDADSGIYRVSSNAVGVSHGGTGGVIGYRDGNKVLFTGSRTLTQSDAGRVMQYNGTGGHTITIPTSGVDEGFMATIINSGSASVSITTSAGNLAWFTGAAVTTGARTLATGGVAVIMVNVSATDCYIWGNAGLT